MSALSITPPFPTFAGKDGLPLEDGYIWLGAANLNPQTSPLVAYWDETLTQVAQQPIRTLGGYPAYSGTPARLFIAAAVYSILVQDKNGNTVYTSPSNTGPSTFINFSVNEEVQVATAGQTVFTLANNYTPGTNSLTVYVDGVNQYDGSGYAFVETSGNTVTFTSGLHVGALVKFSTAIQLSGGAADASQVSYQPAGAGAVTTTVQTKLRETVSVKDFGAVGDGVTDDTVAVQKALDSLPTAGGLVNIPAGCRFNLTTLTFRQNCNMQYYANDDSSTPGPTSDIGSGELVYFSANSSWPTDPTGGAVNEWRFTAAFHPGIIVDVRKDVDGANAYLAPAQTLTEPVRASFNILDEQAEGFTLLYKNFSSNSVFSGVNQNTYRRIFTLNGVGTANWPTLPSEGNLVEGNTSGAAGFVISVDATSTVLLWFSGEFVVGETLHLASPSSNSTSTVTSAVYTSTPMPPLSQDFLHGGWSVALPPQVVTDSFAVGGRIVSTPTRSAGQYTETVVTEPGFGFKSSYESSIRGRYMVATTSTDFKRVVLRDLTTTADIANVGACIGHCAFPSAGGISSSSFNITSVTKSATGIYDVVFLNPAARDDYAVTVTTGAALDYGFVTNKTVNGFTVNIAQTGTATARDATANVSFACFGGDI